MRGIFSIGIAALMIALAGPALAIHGDFDPAFRCEHGYHSSNWNPLQGRAPWRDPVVVGAAPCVAPDGTVFYGVPVRRRIVRERYRYGVVPRRYTHDLDLGGYPAGAPSYRYRFYNP